ncbi:MAG: hypothetical protein PHD13_03980 [Methanocellales archaeon]|nr:hypothetical protein [Methanocellales archaeon]MDD3291214.1 hypothetical protein [Methanocellales archaeon]MDD5235314.1 hypothetical protein [Methanocellales archaeon]MDD5484530.1 hypothetical protein [Methanocellales archaeon]
MARIGSIYIGGSEGKPENGEVFNSGIAFFLETDSKITELLTCDNDWEVEVCQRNQCIIARSKQILTVEQLLSTGFELCQKSLDLLSVKGQGEMNIKSPGDRHAILFNSDGQIILRHVSTTDIGMSISSVSGVILDKDGNIIPEPAKPPVNWIPAFRYYRLSQSSRDLYEAYRNLFLGLESMLSIICPKVKGKGEREWLLQALYEVNKKSPLSPLVPQNCSDPVAYLVASQYDNIRCKLFHAKTETVLPYETFDPTVVSTAYKTLLMLWRQIAIEYFGIKGGGGGMTYQGFKQTTDTVFERQFIYYATGDPSVPTKEDVTITPLDFPVFSFDENKYEGNIESGRALMTGALTKALMQIDVIHRLYSKFSFSYIKDGIYPLGINRLENHEIFRLINKSRPKTIF